MTFATTKIALEAKTNPATLQDYKESLVLLQQLCSEKNTADEQEICKNYAKQLFDTSKISPLFAHAEQDEILEVLSLLKQILDNHKWLTDYSFLKNTLAHIQRAGNKIIQNPLTTLLYSSLGSLAFLSSYLPVRTFTVHRANLITALQALQARGIPEGKEKIYGTALKFAGTFVNTNNLDQEAQNAREAQGFLDQSLYILIPTVIILATYYLGMEENKSSPVVSADWLKDQAEQNGLDIGDDNKYKKKI